MHPARVVLLLGLWLPAAQGVTAQVVTEGDFVVVPLRVHVLSSPDIELASCKMTDAEIARVLGNLNAIWHKAGLHFGIESIRREPAEQRERFRVTIEDRGEELDLTDLQILLPRQSRLFDGLHVYLFHSLPFNSAHVGEDAVFVMEGAQVQKVPGGGDDAVARVMAHALGNALGLPNHTNPRNLMANGTSGVVLNDTQTERARKVARTIRGAATAAEMRKAAKTAEAKNDVATARQLRSLLAGIPGQSANEAGIEGKAVSPAPR